MIRNKKKSNSDPGVRLNLDNKTVTNNGCTYTAPTCESMSDYKELMKKNHLDPQCGASIVTGTIRNIYTNGLLTDDEIKAVPVLRYMDEIAFGDIQHIIASMFIYGSSEPARGIIIKILQNVSETVGYDMSPESMKEISEIVNSI